MQTKRSTIPCFRRHKHTQHAVRVIIPEGWIGSTPLENSGVLSGRLFPRAFRETSLFSNGVNYSILINRNCSFAGISRKKTSLTKRQATCGEPVESTGKTPWPAFSLSLCLCAFATLCLLSSHPLRRRSKTRLPSPNSTIVTGSGTTVIPDTIPWWTNVVRLSVTRIVCSISS